MIKIENISFAVAYLPNDKRMLHGIGAIALLNTIREFHHFNPSVNKYEIFEGGVLVCVVDSLLNLEFHDYSK